MLKKLIAKLISCLDHLAPGQPVVSWRKALTISIGVGVTIFTIEFLNLADGALEFKEWMVIVVFGVSALMIFLYPNSKMYSPLVILEANLLASFVALTCAYLLPTPLIGMIVAIFCTVLGLYFLNCMHPPAFFLGAVIVIAGVDSLDFAFYPVMVDTLFCA
jgi:CBS domain-containing membrane protein